MRYRIPLALSLLLASLGATTAAAAPAPPAQPAPQGTLLITTDAPCTLYVDVEKIAALDAHAGRKLAASPGEYLVTAIAEDGRRWEKVVGPERRRRRLHGGRRGGRRLPSGSS